MRILLLGASGQLGTDLSNEFSAAGCELMTPAHSDLDVRDHDKLRLVASEFKPDAVVSTAAFHKVEECEKQPSVAFDVNAVGSYLLATICEELSCLLMFFSTDYVFDGTSQVPYVEDDKADPVNVYGASKVAGEALIRGYCSRHLIVRTSGLYGLASSRNKGGNFIENMLKRASSGNAIRVVNDQIVSPTYTVDLARAAVKLLSSNATGTYHISSEGECSWFRLTEKLFELRGIRVGPVPVSSDEFPSSVRRPKYSVLSKGRLRSSGIVMPRWEDGLSRYLAARDGAGHEL